MTHPCWDAQSRVHSFLAAALRSGVCLFALYALSACATTAAELRTQPEAPAAAAPAAAAAGKPATPAFKVATSTDGVKIAYEVTGSGPALLLVHGGGQTRRSWHQIGYVDRLAKQFTVIAMDLRGSGDSDRPIRAEAYALDQQLADLLAVADAAGAKQFHVWGFGHGATIARYLAARSARVTSAVLGGATMGPAVTGVFRDAITAMRAKWQPVIDAQAKGGDLKSLSASDRAAWEGGVAVSVLSLGAMLDYPPLEPGEIKVPTLWIVGTDDSAGENVKEYEGKLGGTQVTLKPLSGVNYSDSFIKFDLVLAEVEPFLKKFPTS